MLVKPLVSLITNMLPNYTAPSRQLNAAREFWGGLLRTDLIKIEPHEIHQNLARILTKKGLIVGNTRQKLQFLTGQQFPRAVSLAFSI